MSLSFICLSADHNSPTAGWFLGVGLLTDKSVDQVASSLCKKPGQFCQEKERKNAQF